MHLSQAVPVDFTSDRSTAGVLVFLVLCVSVYLLAAKFIFRVCSVLFVVFLLFLEDPVCIVTNTVDPRYLDLAYLE